LGEVGGQLKYIDLVLLHAPFGGKEGRLGAWKALVEAVEAGTVRSIGVSNYGVPVCQPSIATLIISPNTYYG
jgi:diketogulonate reductase-like aldo/keto reductase